VRRDGFTLLELVVALTIAAIVLTGAFLLMRDILAEQRRAQAAIAAAQDARQVAEELRLALRTHHWEDSSSLAMAATLGTPRILFDQRGKKLYRVIEAVDTKLVAENVEGVDRLSDGMAVRVSRPVGAGDPYRTTWVLRVPGSAP